MNICLFLILLFHTTIGSPFLLVDSTSLPDFANFQLDPVSNNEFVVSSNNGPVLVEQTKPPLLGISTSQDTGPPTIESWFDTAQV